MGKEMTKSFTECPSEDLLVSYVDRALPEWDAVPLEEHLATCDDCAERSRELHRFRQMWEVLRDPSEPVFLGLEAAKQQDPALAALLKELGGRVWSVAKLVYRLPERIPELVLAPALADSPFGQFVLATANQPIRTLGRVPTPGAAGRGGQRHAVARSKGHGGRHEIEIAFDDKSHETLVLLNKWTGGPPPSLVVHWRTPSTAAGETKEQTISVGWIKDRPGYFRAALPSASTMGAEVVIGFGPSQVKP